MLSSVASVFSAAEHGELKNSLLSVVMAVGS